MRYFVWLTSLMKEYEDTLIAEMVKKGFTISPAAADGSVTSFSAGNAGAVIALQVEGKDLKSASELHKTVKKILSDKKVLYYCLMVSAPADCCWCSGNITIPEPPPDPSMPGSKSDM